MLTTPELGACDHRLAESVVTRAGLTQHDFDCEFKSAEDCYLATFDHGLALAARTLIMSASKDASSLTRVRAGLRALLTFFDREPAWARVLLVEPVALGERALARRQSALESLTRLLHRESPGERTDDGFALSRELVAELVVGGVFSVLHARLLRDRARSLVDLAPSLMSMIVLPYLGPAAASAELTATPEPTPALEVQLAARSTPPRTTRRTILVLRAIAASPHSSNRDVAAAAGLSDEGQTSKLLRRLQRRGLVENVGLGQAHGEPNAWLLTSEGQRLVELSSPRVGREPRSEGSVRRAGRARCQS